MRLCWLNVALKMTHLLKNLFINSGNSSFCKFGLLNLSLRQKIVDKLTKLSKMGFSTKLFSENITNNFCNTNVKIWLLGGRLGTHH